MSVHVIESGGGGGIAAMLREIARAIDAGTVPMPVSGVVVFEDEHGRAIAYGMSPHRDAIRDAGLLGMGKLSLELEYLGSLRPTTKPAG